MDKELEIKYEKLKDFIRSLGSVAVAFSAGVDSTFLLKAAVQALPGNVIAVTANASFVPFREADAAREFCKSLGIKHIVLDFDINKIEGFRNNPKNRCYICKKALFSEMKSVALENGASYIIEGSNLDDEGDYRPGMAAIKELGIISPLRICGFTKQEIREVSEALSLVTWNKPSFACLASRFVYGEEITDNKLAMVDQAEQLLFSLGFTQLRVRIHGMMARIEVLPEDIPKVVEKRKEIFSSFKKMGFTYVALDLAGYRTGSMNEVL